MALLPVLLLGAATVFYWYIQINDRRLLSIPASVLKVSPHRWTDSEIKSTYSRLRSNPIDVGPVLPPKTGRRYIVTGGAGFLGGWIVVHLLRRGEDPRRIRVLDIRKPTRPDLTTGIAKDVDFRICDVGDERAVHEAFSAPWTQTGMNESDMGEITVFHTAATIRFFERLMSLVPLSAAVNVLGLQNVINAAQSVGASILVSTSTGSVSLRRSRFWLWPWEDAPPYFVQFIDDDDRLIPDRHDRFFSNYAYTKRLGEALVRGADKSPSAGGRILRTGCIRPGNGVYGPGGDILVGACLIREVNPTWIHTIVQSFVYVENASLAHLCYEQRLLEVSAENTSTSEDLGGQAFCVADKGPPPTYGDVYHALAVLSDGRATFPTLSPTLMLFVSHITEPMYLSRHFLSSLLKGTSFQFLISLLPKLPTELINLQPSLFPLVSVHMIFSDTRAREELGYNPQWTTLEGVCSLVDAFEKSGGAEEERQRSGGGIGLGWMGLGGRKIAPSPTPQQQAMAEAKSVATEKELQTDAGIISN